MATHNLEVFLQQIHHMIDVQEKIAAKTGENFNVFKILGVEAREVRTHSAFLRELLDPKGSHGMGSVFLKLFLTRLPISDSDFDAESASVKPEEYIGRINETYTCGGRIDLVIRDDKYHRHIFIENKIYAGDQENQLFRYHQHNPKATLIYLTLNGDDPSEFSKADNPDIPYIKMAYANEILLWLKECRKEAVTHPVVREALTQYIELICYLTNQTTKEYIMEEIEKLLIKNPEYVDAINKAQNTLSFIVNKAHTEFLRLFKKEFSETDLKLTDNLSIKFVADEDWEGVFIGYRLFDGDKNEYASEIASRYFGELQKMNPGTKFYRTGYQWLCWYNPKVFAPKIKFVNLDPKIILNLYSNPDEMKKFVQCIVEQDQQIRTAFADWQRQDALKE